ncbi:hypothetical protein Bbelb_120620 [Branchiostoma belcheri]|nr:hypothetical protein Bbelb_120620 [Branchiostoma belcheri]
MAAASASLGEQFQEELSCSICLELFTRPKVLPCQHTFCQDCLQDHVRDKKHFECPNCRRHIKLPFQGVPGFHDSHLVTSLCERLQNQATLSEETREQPYSANRCSFHPTEVYRMYCKQCQMPVCVLCLEQDHDDHHTTTLKKALQESKSTVQALINEGRNILESYSLMEEEKKLNAQKQQRDNGIIQAYNQMVQKLAKRRDQLLSESQQNHSKNLERIQILRDRRSTDTNKLSAACDRAEQELQQGGVTFLSQETILKDVVQKYRGKAAPTPVQTQPAVFQPTDTPVPVLGHVTVPSLPSAPISGAPAARGTGHHHGNQRQSAQSLPSASIPPPRARGPPPSSNAVPRGTGHHHGNQSQKELQPQRVTFGGEGSEKGKFNGPAGITASEEGEIFVADRGNHRVQVFTLQGTFVRQFPTVLPGGKIDPYNVGTDREGNLWVVGRTESAQHVAVLYSKCSMRLEMVRVLRTIDLENTCSEKRVPMDIDIRRNHITLTKITEDVDPKYHLGEVQVFRTDGKLVRTVGHKLETVWPQYLNITKDGAGNILLSAYDNHCVHVYKDAQFLFKFGGWGSGEGQLKYPFGICTDRAGNIFVADRGNSRVEMFDKRGKFLKHIATDMAAPHAVAMATQGHLVVTDCSSHTVTIFSNF